MTLRDFISRLIKDHIVKTCPYPYWCLDCNEVSCEGCDKRDEKEEESDGGDKVSSVYTM
jgi:hypothetical protein